MTEELMGIIAELGGGLSAVALVFVALWGWNRQKRLDELTDKFISTSIESAVRDAEWTQILQRILRQTEGHK